MYRGGPQCKLNKLAHIMPHCMTLCKVYYVTIRPVQYMYATGLCRVSMDPSCEARGELPSLADMNPYLAQDSEVYIHMSDNRIYYVIF